MSSLGKILSYEYAGLYYKTIPAKRGKPELRLPTNISVWEATILHSNSKYLPHQGKREMERRYSKFKELV